MSGGTRLDKVAAVVILGNVGVEVAGLFIHTHEMAFAVTHHLILMFFIAELLVRMAIAPRVGKWEVFDGAVIALSLMPVLGEGMLILRVARVARLAHLARHASHLRLLRLPTLVRGGVK